MVAVNDVTGAKLQTGVTTENFRSGYDLIWGKKEAPKVEEQKSAVVIEEKAQEIKLD